MTPSLSVGFLVKQKDHARYRCWPETNPHKSTSKVLKGKTSPSSFLSLSLSDGSLLFFAWNSAPEWWPSRANVITHSHIYSGRRTYSIYFFCCVIRQQSSHFFLQLWYHFKDDWYMYTHTIKTLRRKKENFSVHIVHIILERGTFVCIRFRVIIWWLPPTGKWFHPFRCVVNPPHWLCRRCVEGLETRHACRLNRGPSSSIVAWKRWDGWWFRGSVSFSLLSFRDCVSLFWLHHLVFLFFFQLKNPGQFCGKPWSVTEWIISHFQQGRRRRRSYISRNKLVDMAPADRFPSDFYFLFLFFFFFQKEKEQLACSRFTLEK